MKSTDVLHKVFLVIVVLLINLPNSFGQAEESKDNHEWFRRKFSLQLNSDNTYSNTDTILSSFRKGRYTISDEVLILYSQNDSSEVSEEFPIAEINQNKF